MYNDNDLMDACYENNYIKILNILKDLKKNEYVSDILMDCFIGSMKFLHEDLMLKILEFEERLALEYYEHYDIYLILYSLELGLDKLSNKILEIMKKYGKIENKRNELKLRYSNEYHYNNIINKCNVKGDNMLMITLYANNSDLALKIMKLRGYGKLDYSHKNNIKHTSLIIAINSNMLKTAYLIMEQSDNETINYVDLEGNNILLYSIINKQYDFMMYILKMDNIKCDVVNYNTGKNGLHFLTEYGEQMYSIILINRCPSMVYEIDYEYNSILLNACKKNMLIVIKKILELYKNHNDRDYLLKLYNKDFESVFYDYQHIDMIKEIYNKYYI
jgi:hypothetical protein